LFVNMTHQVTLLDSNPKTSYLQLATRPETFINIPFTSS
jgi:hypothetical protein